VTIELIRGIYNLKPCHRGCVVTIGNFDGIHIGHQALLNKIKDKAAALQVPSMVITFEPLPKEFFRPDNPVPRLTRWREKFTLLSQYGIDRVLVVHFNDKFAHVTAHDFVEKILHHGLDVKHVIIGDDFRFGYQREGSFSFLKTAGQGYGFTVEDMPSVVVNNERVSSTLVRDALVRADHDLAAKLLGRAYTMQGRVVHGHKRGRTIGFPTANIYLHRAVTPVKGVYAVRMHGMGETALPGVANVGVRPTIGGTRSLLEVHLFDFNREIYGQHVQVEFCEKLRDEKRFDSLDLLKQQIWKDAEEARHYFVKQGEGVI
jgi:riboflavin kinase / FMN adenylyltransferase